MQFAKKLDFSSCCIELKLSLGPKTRLSVWDREHEASLEATPLGTIGASSVAT